MGCTMFLLILIHLFSVGLIGGSNLTPTTKFTSILVFGDSTVDTGNNNYRLTIAKANYWPYGMDLAGHIPRGRFSNGRVVPDFIASMLNIKESIPPFLYPNLSDEEILTGVCFASGGSGIDEITAPIVNAISMEQQIQYFKMYISRLKQIIGEDEVMEKLQNALVMISIGSNDFIFNFYNVGSRRPMFPIIDTYQDYILDKFVLIIKELYDLGCRNIGVVGLAPLGCVPFQRTYKVKINRECVMEENADSAKYNQKLAQRLFQLQATLPGSKIIYADLYYSLLNLFNNPQKYGMEVTNKGCCGLLGYFEMLQLCNQLPVCEDHSKYVFWDSVHLTEAAYQYLAKYIVREVLPLFLKPE